jgi:DNA-binding MarR family transcriptional regulator
MVALQLDKQICFALYRASRAIVRAYDPLLKPLSLTYLQYLVLLVLWEADGISVKHLGERLDLDSATLTPLLKRLESQGMVIRERADKDQRVVQVHLTQSGKALRKKAEKIPEQIACSGGFDINDISDLALIGQLREQLISLAEKYQH